MAGGSGKQPEPILQLKKDFPLPMEYSVCAIYWGAQTGSSGSLLGTAFLFGYSTHRSQFENRSKQMRSSIYFILSMLLLAVPPQTAWAQAVLENPQPASVQSGIGVISGWVCDAQQVDIEIDGAAVLRAGYGTSRADTQAVCGDIENGFGLLFNWNLLDDGVHTLRALADGVEFGTVTFRVATFGEEFLQGASGQFAVNGFPQSGDSIELEWQQSLQNFVIAQGAPSGGGDTGTGERILENPQPGSIQSGIGVISGFVCDAERVDIEIDGSSVLRAGYGTSRADTQVVCGDSENGFGLLFNWNLLGDGTHTIQALADGAAFATVTFTVTTFGTEFLQDASGTFTLPSFPEGGTDVRVRWQQSLQNFTIEGLVQAGITQGECGTRDGMLTDTQGQTINAQVTNPCSRQGESAEMLIFPFFSATTQTAQAQGMEFFACFALLSIEQDGMVFTGGTDFVWIDGNGQEVCRMLSQSLATILVVNPDASLNFNRPFRLIYNTLAVVEFAPAAPPPAVAVSPSSLDFGNIPIGGSVDRTFTITNVGGGTLTGSWEFVGFNCPTCPFSFPALGPGESTVRTVRVDAGSQAGPQSASIVVTTNGGTRTISITWQVVDLSPPAVAVSPSSLNFGDIPVGGSVDRSFTITNTGGGTLTGSWEFMGINCSTCPIAFPDLGPSESATQTARITAGNQTGLQSASIVVNTNAGSRTIPITWRVVDLSPPAVAVSPSSLNFGDIPVGGSVDRSFTITNTGGGTLTGSWEVVGINCSACPFPFPDLGAGENTTQTLRITAGNQLGSQSATIVVNTNAGSRTIPITWQVVN